MRNILRISLPLTVWIIGFCAIYGLQGLICSRHWPADIDPRGTLIAAGAVLALAQAGVLAAIVARPSRSRFVQMTATILGAAALGAALWTSLPVLAVTICG